MTYYNQIFDEAIGNYGIVTSSKAKEIGVPVIELAKLAMRGRLRRLGYGVYKLAQYSPAPDGLDAYADSLALAGDGAYLYAQSVLAMHHLCPTNPARIYIATPRRARRNLGDGIVVVGGTPCADPAWYEGLPSQSVPLAIRTSRGAIMDDRLRDAIATALRKELIDKTTARKLERELDGKGIIESGQASSVIREECERKRRMTKSAAMKSVNVAAVAAAALLAGCSQDGGRQPGGEQPKDALSVIAERTSVRRYENREVPDEAVEKLLRAAMCAPTAINLQPWEFIVVKDKAALAQLAAANRYGGMIAQAPLAIVVCGDTLQEASGQPNKWWMLDCSAATENILLAATAQGLGAVWTAAYPHEDRIAAVRKILSIPERYVPLCVVPVGYPADPTARPKDKWRPSKIHKERF